MLVFPNCKINLGLNITGKRADGFHNIETVFYPVNWCDALEIIEDPAQKEPFLLTQSGILIDGKQEDNLIYKAWKHVSGLAPVPPIKVHLHKVLPMGAGLGGGSADAAFFIRLLNTRFKLGFSLDQMQEIASKLGSDCSFFIANRAVLAKGKGDEFSNINIDLSGYYILVVFPDIHSNTKEAYDGVDPKPAEKDLKNIIETTPIANWRNMLNNDFEKTVFIKYPKIKELKERFYASGALYASMSGSGSSVFGIFDKEPAVDLDKNVKFYLQTPASKIL